MKYVVILADGMSDYPVDALNGKTPLEVAKKPNMDFFAKNGELLYVKTVPENLKPGSDVANLSVMGYDSAEFYTGRSPLEAASIGVELKDNDTTFRANLVTLSDEANYADKTMVDYSSDEISTEEADAIIQTINEHFRTEKMRFYTGTSYRHLLVWEDAPAKFHLTPPHDISDKKITDYLPDDPTLRAMMEQSYDILKNHPVNLDRIRRGLHPATSLWIWGEGSKPQLANFYERYGLKGNVISAVDLIKGIGVCVGLTPILVEGATGNITTNFRGKADACVNALKSGADFVYVHIEAPDECGHRGEVENKIASIERIDKDIIGVVRDYLEQSGEDYAMMVLPDHPTPLSLKTHVRDSVPCAIYRKGMHKDTDRILTEAVAKEQGEPFAPGYKLMDRFLDR